MAEHVVNQKIKAIYCVGGWLKVGRDGVTKIEAVTKSGPA